MKSITVTQLRWGVEDAEHAPHFFSKTAMRFFGDTLRNYGVCSTRIVTNFDADHNYAEGAGVEMDVWELYRKKPVKFGLQKSRYFDKVTFEPRHGKEVCHESNP